jgi:hypothetical protein
MTAFPVLARSREWKAPRACSGRNGQGPRAPSHRRPQPRSRERTTGTSQLPETPADAPRQNEKNGNQAAARAPAATDMLKR